MAVLSLSSFFGCFLELLFLSTVNFYLFLFHLHAPKGMMFTFYLGLKAQIYETSVRPDVALGFSIAK